MTGKLLEKCIINKWIIVGKKQFALNIKLAVMHQKYAALLITTKIIVYTYT